MVKQKAKLETTQKTASKTEEGLNFKQEEFCQTYTNGDRELFGNGTQCYLEVYGLEDENGKRISYQTAMVNASKLLRNTKIIGRINELLETGGFNDENIDKQTLFLINQHADFKAKISAIREYNQLKTRIKKAGDSPDNPVFVSFDPTFNKNDSTSETERDSS